MSQTVPRVAAIPVATAVIVAEKAKTPSRPTVRKVLVARTPTRAPTTSSSSSCTSPRMSKKLHRLEAATTSSKSAVQAFRSRLVFVLLLAVYLGIALGFVLYVVVDDPSQVSKLLSEASLASENVPKNQVSFGHAPPFLDAPTEVSATGDQQQQQYGNVQQQQQCGGVPQWQQEQEQCDGVHQWQQEQCCQQQSSPILIQQQCPQQQQCSDSRSSISEQPWLSAVSPNRKRLYYDQGRVDGVKYYQCNMTMTPARSFPDTSRDVVVLDAKRFFDVSEYTNHLTSKVNPISRLCNSGLLDSVTILDLDGTEKPETLMTTLEGLFNQGLLPSLPVAALITPGTSSNLLMDWILYGDSATLPQRVADRWILVSAGSTVLQALGAEVDERNAVVAAPTKEKDDDDDDTYLPVGIDNVSTILDVHVVDNNRQFLPLRVIDSWPTLTLHCRSGDEMSRRVGYAMEQQVSRAEVRTISGDGSNCFVHEFAAASDLVLDYLWRAWQTRMLE